LFVVFYHARLPFFSGGYIGVDVFFVISGYLISGLLMREVEQKGRIDLLRFYARRMRRLLPAAAVVLVATVIAARIWLSPLEQLELAPSVLFSALYASNLLFAFKATDYLAGDVHSNLLLHTWSLSVEEQFYLMWPAVILLGAYLAMKTRRRSSAPFRAGALVSMASVCVLSLGLALWTMKVSQPWAFFGSPMRAWEFAAGGLAFMVTPYVARRCSDRVKDALVALGFAVTLGAVLFFDDRTPFPGLAALVPVVGTVLMIVAGTGRGLMTWWLGTPIMQTIGNVSYSWYLWHWPVLLLFPLIGPLRGLGAGVTGLVVSFVLAWATYHLVENRVRFSPLLAPSPMRSIVLAVCLTVMGTGSALALRSMARVALASPEQAKYIHVRDDLPSIYRDGCHQSVRKEAVPDCVYGDPTGRRTVVVFGDSHAAQWFPAFDRIARQNGWKLISLTKSACPSVWVTPYRPELGRRYVECERWRALVAQRIAQEHPALVILANSSDHVQISQREVNGKASRGIEPEQWRDGMRATLAKLGSSAGSIVILRDTPFPGFDVPTCLSKAAWKGENALAACSFDRRQALNGNVFALERQAADGLANVSVIDLSDLLCTSSTCAPLLAGGLAYRDDHHLTVGASRGLASALLERLGSRFTH
jgi:peptidoglycan/LPS O-acetylase OafA/YrhL